MDATDGSDCQSAAGGLVGRSMRVAGALCWGAKIGDGAQQQRGCAAPRCAAGQTVGSTARRRAAPSAMLAAREAGAASRAIWG